MLHHESPAAPRGAAHEVPASWAPAAAPCRCAGASFVRRATKRNCAEPPWPAAARGGTRSCAAQRPQPSRCVLHTQRACPSVELAVEQRVQQEFGFERSSCRQSPFRCHPCFSASRRARASRDITVPMGLPTTSAISLYDKSLISRRTIASQNGSGKVQPNSGCVSSTDAPFPFPVTPAPPAKGGQHLPHHPLCHLSRSIIPDDARIRRDKCHGLRRATA